MTGERPDTYVPLHISDGLRVAAARTPDRIALVAGERSLTFGQLLDRVRRLATAAAYDLGLARGDRAAVMAPNCLEYLELICGIAAAGAAAVAVSPRLTAAELAYICNDSGARALFVAPALEELARSASLETVERVIAIDGDYEAWLQRARPAGSAQHEEWDPFCISYTSGTTGRPKGAVLSHRSRCLTFFGMAAEYGCFSSEDQALAVAPLYHGGGLAFALAPVWFGASCHILERFDPEHVLATMESQAITNVFMVPTHFEALFGLGESTLARYRTPSLRAIVSNAAPLPQPSKERIVERFGPGILHETYGSTEAGIVLNIKPADQLRKLNCVGQPFAATDVVLLDDAGREVGDGEIGELHSSSPYLFNGYWADPAATADSLRDGWFSAGDLAMRDEEGYYYIVGRKKDMIISGGVNVYPREIEDVLHAHPAVVEAAVVGFPDDYWGEVVRACVVVRGRVGEDELRAHCAETLASFKLPKAFVFMDALPKSPAGKILRRELRQPDA